MTPIARAIAVNLAQAGYTHEKLAEMLGASRTTITALVKRTEKRAQELGVPLHDDALYQTLQQKRGRQDPVLTVEHKDMIEQYVLRDKEHSKHQSKQIRAFMPLEFPSVSCSTIESALYERGYRRIKHQWKLDKPAAKREKKAAVGQAEAAEPGTEPESQVQAQTQAQAQPVSQPDLDPVLQLDPALQVQLEPQMEPQLQSQPEEQLEQLTGIHFAAQETGSNFLQS
ncbi:hypothetical protein K461DRAFT_289570 [Myriangium duriaei CBS 260.36]|uniref:Uncharacterized protein n=1 Tax=Myriangium duriaei CBS 260.36 TaxID=1168546 RepID=A0A9P4JDX6_9PEZI|nr:hypothetical protein K461DRAFT_289570 [Myriangium duriaei CBS 260.36]